VVIEAAEPHDSGDDSCTDGADTDTDTDTTTDDGADDSADAEAGSFRLADVAEAQAAGVTARPRLVHLQADKKLRRRRESLLSVASESFVVRVGSSANNRKRVMLPETGLSVCALPCNPAGPSSNQTFSTAVRDRVLTVVLTNARPGQRGWEQQLELEALRTRKCRPSSTSSPSPLLSPSSPLLTTPLSVDGSQQLAVPSCGGCARPLVMSR
jgi:hypothetical protein